MLKKMILDMLFCTLFICNITLSMDEKTCEFYCKKLKESVEVIPQQDLVSRNFESTIETFKASEENTQNIVDRLEFYIKNYDRVIIYPHIFNEEDCNEKEVIKAIYTQAKKFLRVKNRSNLFYTNLVYFKDNETSEKIITSIAEDTWKYISDITTKNRKIDKTFAQCAMGLQYRPDIFKSVEIVAIKFERD